MRFSALVAAAVLTVAGANAPAGVASGTAALAGGPTGAAPTGPGRAAVAKPATIPGPSGLTRWQQGPALPRSRAGGVPAMVSCGSPELCVALDQQMSSGWLYRGGRWSLEAHIGPPGGFGVLTGLQCFSGGTCLATDAEADLVSYQGGRWRSRPGPTDNGGGPMGCASADLCLFVDGVGQAYTWDGRSFSRPSVPYASLANTMGSVVADIACALGSTSCVVADTLGYLAIDRAGHWSPLARPYAGPPLGVGCLSADRCVAGFGAVASTHGAKGAWVFYDGRTWAESQAGQRGTPADLSEVAGTLSCVPGSCYALDGSGRGEKAVAWDGSTWEPTAAFGAGSDAPDLLACAARSWCLALFVPTSGSSPGRTWLMRVPLHTS